MWSLLCLAVLSALIGPSLQNRIPYFVQDLSQKLEEQGVEENTPRGTVLGSISCVDEDNDPIQYSIADNKYIEVDSRDGSVTVVGDLDREETGNSASSTNEPYIVGFRCSDLDIYGNIKSQSRADYVLTVLDQNDQTPVFSINSPNGFTFNVSESAARGYVLNGTITVSDSDTGTNAIVSVKFVCTPPNPSPCELFDVEYELTNPQKEGNYSVRIYVKDPQYLDYESDAAYNMKLIAVDGNADSEERNTGSIGLRILVQDSQDTNPRFENAIFNFDVEEGLPRGSAVNFLLSAQDLDKGSQRDIYIEILDDPNGVNFFEAGQASRGPDGIFSAPVLVKSEIDREKASDVYSFTAKATELDSSGALTTATATAVFTVNIRDINDNPPRFTNTTYRITVPEVNQILSNLTYTVPNLEVHDADIFENATYRVEILSQTHPGAFGITPTAEVEGKQAFYLTVNNYNYVDYDVPSYRSQQIILRARETRTLEQRSSTATILVTITDVNDHDPEFENDRYESSVREDTAPSTWILTVKAKDDDTGADGQVTYSIQSFRDIFAIDSQTGNITLIGSLNYEEKRTYAFLVYAVDKGQVPRTGDASVVIRVTGYNKIGPRFMSVSYSATVSESSTVFLDPVRVEAVDTTDTLANITYRIVSGNTPTNSFVLNPFTGELSLRENVAFEQTDNLTGYFNLAVEATDNGQPPRTTQTIIVVQVLDENNNMPKFNPTLYTKTISEAIPPNTFLLQVFATDDDYGSNGKITYRIGTGGRDSFFVRENGEVYISGTPTFDYDVMPNLNVQILATDGGSPQHSATATMLITLTDANNKLPDFSQRLYNKILDEATTKGSPVLQVTATDPDSGHDLRYSLLLNSFSGLNKAGSEVENSNEYDMTKVFDIDPLTGQISLSMNGPGLDRSFVAEMSFQVKVEDINAATGTVQTDISYVSIIITGRPETALYFNRPWTKARPEYRLLISEASPVGTEIKTLQARDPVDRTVVNQYEKVAGTDPENYFRLSYDPPGVVYLNKALDFESGDLVHSVVIRAIKEATSDYQMRTVTASIIVEVVDANDNRPIFTRQSYNFSVSESVPVNYEVWEITAYDTDSSSFGPIEFSLEVGQGKDDFKLLETDHPNTVKLLVAEKLDFEKRSKYTIKIIAKDNKNKVGSSLQLQNSATINIKVLDENDNTPTFSDTERAFSVPETAPIDQRLGQILARDDDNGINGHIQYSLVRDNNPNNRVNPLSLFKITSESGVLFTQQSLLGLSGSYSMLVMARDRGTPPKSATVPVTIKVQPVDSNDGTPEWILPTDFNVYVEEHKRTQLNIKIKARARSSNNSYIKYSFGNLGSDSQYFFINELTGDINVTADLDREIQPTYKLLLVATDALEPNKLSRRELTVHLTDIDDNGPSFEKAPFYPGCPSDFEVPTTFDTPDDTANNTIVGFARACDPDADGNDVIHYYRYNGSKICLDNYDDALQVNENGTIQSTKVLDFEEKQEYLVCVTVQFSLRAPGGRQKRSFDVRQMNETDKVGYVVIEITDRNDNGPTFPDKAVVAVMATEPSENEVFKVKATDPDGPLNNVVVYSMTSILYYPPDGGDPYSMRGTFTVTSDTGRISANLPSYDDFAYGRFQLEILARDAKDPLFNDTITVTLVVHQDRHKLRLVLDVEPLQGWQMADDLIMDLNKEGEKDGKQFFLTKVTEHREGSRIVATQTDVCFVMVDNLKPVDADVGLEAQYSKRFKAVTSKYHMVDQGTCESPRSSEDSVKWRDLWWLLVVIAVFIFICALILLVTICILYDRHKSYMTSQRTYLVPDE
ncbi:cadherin-87A-like [Babylonia areolata]|uniref:cadherin-87A-like n=1 Tax=Babylonia areolata TaxID=304850 RepID=UPI003FD45934